MKPKLLYIPLLLGLVAGGTAWGEDQGLLSIENKYIKVFLNNSAEETGRFAVDVTGGDQERSDDDNKPLIYGRPKPWTSFTTIRIDGANYVFGKPTIRRSGAKLPGGAILGGPKTEANRLVMACEYGPILVEQALGITRSPSTGALDTAKIQYTVINRGSVPAEVGLRVMLDTMVGDNDGAPFRIGSHEVTGDFEMAGAAAPDFWQAFDSLAKPAVIAQGTLKGGDVTTPDRLVFTNWGKAADHPWEIPLKPGADFTRTGEDELDSSLVMFWQPRTVNPGEPLTVVIYYGLGGITFSPGNTYLGITAPAEVLYSLDQARDYQVLLYLEHRGEVKAEKVTVNLELPEGLDCVSGPPQVELAELIPGVTRQLSWTIRPNGKAQGETQFTIKVAGTRLEANQVTRRLWIIGPPRLEGALAIPTLTVEADRWRPDPLPVTVTVKNSGESAARDLKAVVALEGFTLVPGERAEKYLEDLESQAATKVTWMVSPLSGGQTGTLRAEITGTGVKPLGVSGPIEIPALPTRIVPTGPERLYPGQVYNLDLTAVNLIDAVRFQLNLTYDPQQIRLIYVSRGTFLVEDDELSPWSSGTLDNQNGSLTGLSGARIKPFTGAAATLARLNFMVVGAGSGQIQLEGVKLFDSSGKELPCAAAAVKYQIGEGKK
jgi:hypothetical protein